MEWWGQKSAKNGMYYLNEPKYQNFDWKRNRSVIVLGMGIYTKNNITDKKGRQIKGRSRNKRKVKQGNKIMKQTF